MDKAYSYSWYIQRFQDAKGLAVDLIKSAQNNYFLQSPPDDQWSAAECYDHLITFGQLYLKNMIPAIAHASATTHDLQQAFEPRWIVDKVISVLEPPYKMKFKTFQSMNSILNADHDPEKLLKDYLDLQDLLIDQLNEAKNSELNLSKTKVPHPVFPIVKMTLSECFALIEVHQRRHQWQAQQTLDALK